MMLWKLERLDEVDYDETQGFVIRAESEAHARKLAYRHAWGWARVWLDPEKTSCRQIIAPGRAGVVLQANLNG